MTILENGKYGDTRSKEARRNGEPCGLRGHRTAVGEGSWEEHTRQEANQIHLEGFPGMHAGRVSWGWCKK